MCEEIERRRVESVRQREEIERLSARLRSEEDDRMVWDFVKIAWGYAEANPCDRLFNASFESVFQSRTFVRCKSHISGEVGGAVVRGRR